MTKEELRDYRTRFWEEHKNYGPQNSITLKKKHELKNAEDTSNRKAWGGVSWINYWQALGNFVNNVLECSCEGCKKKLLTDIDA